MRRGCCTGSEWSRIAYFVVNRGMVGKAEGAIKRMGVGVIFFSERCIGREGFTMAWVRWVFMVITKMSGRTFMLLRMIATVAAVRVRFC